MSEFSDLCRDYIKISRTNVYQIAKKSNLDRTMLQKMINGSRLPSEEFFTKFLTYLSINKDEQQNLIKLYQIERIGRPIYERRLAIQNMLNSFEFKRREILSDQQASIITGTFVMNEKVEEIENDTDVYHALQMVIKYEYDYEDEIRVYFNSFERSRNVHHALIRSLKKTGKSGNVSQFITFSRFNNANDSDIKNIDNLGQLLPFIFTYNDYCQVYYTYDDATHLTQRLWPFFLVTHNHVLLLSNEQTRGILIHDRNVASLYAREIDQLKSKNRILTDVSRDDKKSLQTFNDFARTHRLLLSYETIPCISDLVMPMYERVKDDYPVLANYLEGASDVYANVSPHDYISIQGLSGMKDFIEKGVLPELFGDISPTFTPEERLEMLRHYLSIIDKFDDYHVCRLGVIGSASGLAVELYENDVIVMTSMKKDPPLRFVFFQEPIIYQEFYDYFTSLIDQEHVYTNEELRRDIKSMVDDYM
ncbi:MAG: hypothetical protein J6P61_07365 [Erysipelotrichaceae bacterium]|nr:hypothetical protein [Erysipelotrichaceae bacterium]